MNDLEFIKLYDKIHVYKNLFADLEKMLKDLKEINSHEWEDWYTFGKQRTLNNTEIPSGDLVIKYSNKLNDVLEITTKHFMNYYQMDQSEIMYPTGQLCSYYPIDKNNEVGSKMIMTYHVDYQQEKMGSPGLFHYVTCNMYLNDNYSGGDVCFSINDDNFAYKPVAGDVIVFPSRPPYYHGVKKTYDAEKYFFRSFVMKLEPGSDEWIKNQEKYGKELWEEMEREREKKERTGYIKYQDYQTPTLKILNDK